MAKPVVSGGIGDEQPATPQPIVGAGPTGHEGTPADEADARSSARSRARHAAASPDWPTSGRYGRAIHAVRRCRHGALPNTAFSPSSEPASNASSTPSVCRCLRLPNVGSSPFSQTDARAPRPRVENADDRLGYARSLADRITTRFHRSNHRTHMGQFSQTFATDLTHTGFNPAVARPDVAAGTGRLRVKIISRQFHEEGTRQHM
jgi:hypothetical protein